MKLYAIILTMLIVLQSCTVGMHQNNTGEVTLNAQALGLREATNGRPVVVFEVRNNLGYGICLKRPSIQNYYGFADAVTEDGVWLRDLVPGSSVTTFTNATLPEGRTGSDLHYYLDYVAPGRSFQIWRYLDERAFTFASDPDELVAPAYFKAGERVSLEITSLFAIPCEEQEGVAPIGFDDFGERRRAMSVTIVTGLAGPYAIQRND